MGLNEKTVLTIPEELLINLALKKQDNRYDEDVYLLYNPIGYSGVLTVGKQVVDLINMFDGNRDIKTAINDVGFNKEDAEAARRIVDLLVNKQILKSKEIVSNKGEWKRELTCWLHITNDCNLRCKYCYIHKTHSNMPNSIIYESINKMLESCRRNDYSTLSLMLVGGEPLMRFDTIKEIVSYCSSNKGDINVRYIIPTNGTLITPDVAKYIAENHISVGISIDGIGKYNDKNRIRVDGSGSYEMALKGIDNLIEQGIKPSIMITVTQQNLEGLPELTKLMIQKKLYFRFSFERDTQTGNPEILKNQEYCIKMLKQCFKIMEESLNIGETGWFFKFGDVTFGKPYRRACAAGKNFFSIGQDGSIGSCSLGLESPRSNITEINDVITDIDDIFSDISKTSACDVEECSKCIWRHSCAGACPLQTYASYKTYAHISPYCALYKACLPDVIRIHAMTIYYNNKKEEV